MKLSFETTPIPNFPAPDGAHKLAWSYLLDYLFADAYQQGVNYLEVDAPHEKLVNDLQLRANLSTTHVDAVKAQAFLSKETSNATENLIYKLRLGKLAPSSLQTPKQSLDGYHLSHCLNVYTLKTKLLGIPMRLGNMIGQPYLADKALIALRRGFATALPTPAFYHLETWVKD